MKLKMKDLSFTWLIMRVIAIKKILKNILISMLPSTTVLKVLDELFRLEMERR